MTRGLSFGSVAEAYNRFRPPYLRPLVDRAGEALALSPDARVIAVEPDDSMRAPIDAGTVLAGTAEAIPLKGAAVDAVFCAEAFHWFDTRAAIAEVVRVLAAGGGLAILSTYWWETEPPLPVEAERLLHEPFEAVGGRMSIDWESFAVSPFEPLREEPFEEELAVDADTLLAMYSTVSSLASIGHEQRATVLGAVRPLLAGPYRLPVKHTLRWTRLHVG